ncbi:MAG: cupin fold metalloprotein, WbuC family, partial [Chlamydiae bacterium]|nr:cupin fold metalloprotein, WbuC family [Chlamydiota bacterium]
TPWLVFLEITKGPFRRHQTVFAPWSPEANRISDGIDFLKNAK